jgi:hypothetical protein
VSPSDPLAAPGRVDVDPDSRTLIVRPAPQADAYAKLLWRAGHSTLTAEERTGYGHTVWADSPGHEKVAPGMPGADGTVRFKFHDAAAWREVASLPDLRAYVVLNRRTKTILGVTFRGERAV